MDTIMGIETEKEVSPRADSVLEISPLHTPPTPYTPYTPSTPKRLRPLSSELTSPGRSPKRFAPNTPATPRTFTTKTFTPKTSTPKTTTPKTFDLKTFTPKTVAPRTIREQRHVINTKATSSIRLEPTSREADLSRKRTKLQARALTGTEADKFTRIVEWDANWHSTLSLPICKYYPNASYFEAVFLDQYPMDGQKARRHHSMQEGPEPDHVQGFDSFGGPKPSQPPMSAADIFDFAGYYEGKGEPREFAPPGDINWHVPSLAQGDLSGDYVEEAMRVQNGSRTRWLNRR